MAIQNRPTDLPNLTNNHTNLSPVNSNSAWNSDSWADGEFEPIEEPILGNIHIFLTNCRIKYVICLIESNVLILGNTKLDEARRKREEKKIQRQRELEARRVARGPLKLGAKKL